RRRASRHCPWGFRSSQSKNPFMDRQSSFETSSIKRGNCATAAFDESGTGNLTLFSARRLPFASHIIWLAAGSDNRRSREYAPAPPPPSRRADREESRVRSRAFAAPTRLFLGSCGGVCSAP